MSVSESIAHSDLAALDRLKARIQGLRSKTTDNGCTEAEALLAATKVAELLDRYVKRRLGFSSTNYGCSAKEPTPRLCYARRQAVLRHVPKVSAQVSVLSTQPPRPSGSRRPSSRVSGARAQAHCGRS